VPHLDDNTLKVLRVLEQHKSLDVLQVAALAEVTVSAAHEALGRLVALDLVTQRDHGDDLYSLDGAALSRMLEVA
jgi:DNA-binding IclR family transcriptional regulator